VLKIIASFNGGEIQVLLIADPILTPGCSVSRA